MNETIRLTAALAGRYAIERQLGAGGMATVYLARDLRHDRDVALKVLRPELAAVLGAERFLREISISARLDHPHILTLIDSGESEGYVWYVLPYVRGESLRNKLTREQQLSIEETVRIATQVASALDYAHRHGVIHRDIKPENILLHEGEAVVADFGIALAVRDAGGPRLTESGLSLGTPQYMSPEQATGGRELDARSDVYSLAAVVYEMLAGEPPHTGPTVQAVIAKLLTERPTRIRTVRDTVPEGIDAAVAKALAKVPADRFGGAAEFAAALAVSPAEPTAGGRRRRVVVAAGIVGALAIGAGLWLGVRAAASRKGPAFVALDRSQLTFTGNATTPAISADGKQLAYVVKRCTGATCSYGIEIQDVGGGESRRISDGATALYSIWWSPDRRFLIFVGTIASRFGSYIVSTLHGAPRYLGIVIATFFPDGDSLVVTPWQGRDRTVWAWMTTLEGDHRDSMQIEDVRLPAVVPLAGGHWMVVQTSVEGNAEWRIVDRRGRVRDRFRWFGAPPDYLRPRTAGGALWLQLRSPGSRQWAVVRVPIDARSGTFAGRPDTVLVTSQEGFDVTADGGAVVYGEGTNQYSVWAVELTDALHGRFAGQRRLLSSTSQTWGAISPDGDRVLVAHRGPGLDGERDVIDVVSFAGRAVLTHSPSGALVSFDDAGWMPDGAAFSYAERADSAVRFVTLDARTGARLATFAIADSTVVSFDPLAGGGWVWIPPSLNGLRVQRPGEPRPRDLPTPDRNGNVISVAAAPDGGRLVTIGWNATNDSMRVHVISLPDGRAVRWATFFGEYVAKAAFLADGSVVIPVWETQESVTLYRLRGPGRIERVGTIPRPVDQMREASDGRRVVVSTREFQGDIWLARIERVGH